MKRKMVINITLLFGFAFFGLAGAHSLRADTVYVPAERGIQSQNYGSLVRRGHEALQAGQKGTAALYYERARVLSDASPALRHNLKTLRAESGADRYDLEVHPLARLVFFMYYYCTRADLVSMMYFAALLLFLLIGFTTFTGKRIGRITNLISGAIIVFIVFCCIGYLYREHEVRSPDRAVVMAATPLYARADAGEQPLALLPETSLVRVVQKGGGEGAKLCRVALPNGASGWLLCSEIAMINDSGDE
jgi:hypothetical protein